jgi:phosphoribosylanthranilate isomerase
MSRSGRTRIKISGLKTPEDATRAVALGADMISCVFWSKSPRYVTLSEGWAVRRVLPADVPFVGIFVDTPLPLVQRIADHCRLDHVQLFGRESRDDVESVRPHGFKAITATSSDQVEQGTKSYLGLRPGKLTAPAMLIDLTGPAQTMWRLAASASAKAPVILASRQLLPETAEAAIASVKPWGVDVWGTVESEPGVLNEGRFKAFVAAVREADRKLRTKTDS